MLPILLIAQVVVSLAIFYSNYLIYFEKTALILWAGLGISILSVVLNLLLIPNLKSYGAAITLLISNGCYLIIYYAAFRHYKIKSSAALNRETEQAGAH